MALQLTVVDAFTSEPFGGNPAAVAIVGEGLDEARMQLVARELNLSETAFAVRRVDGTHDLRWFTPTVEVDLCGHATLATAHVLGGSATFHTRSGVLACIGVDDGWIEMDFPADAPIADDPPMSFELPGMRWYGRGKSFALVELSDASSVRSFQPDLTKLSELGPDAVIVTAGGDRAGVDCVSRVFAPRLGIPEDPATGSAHCLLAVFWGERLGCDTLVGEQASARGGTVRMRRAGNRVMLSGQAVTMSEVTVLV
jgi:predicted PhzF superfamily epimerase YddE/YHI9